MPSQKANKYGTAAEKYLADERGLSLERAYHMDARRSNGAPVEIKACDVDSTGYFQLYRKAHRKLQRQARRDDATAWYGFVPYRVGSSGGMSVVDTRMVRASKLPLLRWSGTGGHRGSKKARVDVGSVL